MDECRYQIAHDDEEGQAPDEQELLQVGLVVNQPQPYVESLVIEKERQVEQVTGYQRQRAKERRNRHAERQTASGESVAGAAPIAAQPASEGDQSQVGG